MNANKEKMDIEPQDYNRIVSKANLAALRMIKSAFEIKPDYIVMNSDSKEYELVRELDDALKDFRYDKNSGIAFSEIMWQFRVRFKNRILLKKQCSYIIIYTNIKKEKERHVQIFLDHMAPSQSYPYFRQRVAQAAADAMIEVPLLPMLKLRAPVKKT